MKFSIKDFFSKCELIQRKLHGLLTFAEKILNGKININAALINIFWFIVEIAATIILQSIT